MSGSITPEKTPNANARVYNAWASDAFGRRRYQPHFLPIIHRAYRTLTRLLGTVIVPDAVHKELCHPAAPPVPREWIVERPSWLEVIPVDVIDDDALRPLGAGGRAAITLAISIHADLILIDERKGTAVALTKGFEVTGTLGILRPAAKDGLIDIAAALATLKQTNFRYRQEMIDDLLNEFPAKS